MTQNHLTFPEARAVVLCTCEAYLEQLPADITPEDEAITEELLDLKLAYWLGGYVHHVEYVLNALRWLTDLDNGDHGSLIQTRNGTIDEGGEIRSSLDGMLDDALRDTVNSAGIYATRDDLGLVAA